MVSALFTIELYKLQWRVLKVLIEIKLYQVVVDFGFNLYASAACECCRGAGSMSSSYRG